MIFTEMLEEELVLLLRLNDMVMIRILQGIILPIYFGTGLQRLDEFWKLIHIMCRQSRWLSVYMSARKSYRYVDQLYIYTKTLFKVNSYPSQSLLLYLWNSRSTIVYHLWIITNTCTLRLSVELNIEILLVNNSFDT